jgi:GGDEF domain-containing protein
MVRRILVVDESEAVITALRRDLEFPGREVVAVAPADAAERVAATRFSAAIVRGTLAPEHAFALRAADPSLPVILLYLDRKEAARQPPAVKGDATLVGPLTPSSVAATCTLAEELRVRGDRIAELERQRMTPAQRELEFLKRLLFVEVHRSKRYGFPLSLALLSVDGWDQLAPKLGGKGRTALLAELLGVVRGALRDIDVAVPFSEERLLVLMPHTKAEGGLKVARRLCSLARDRRGAPSVTVSGGIAGHDGDGTVSFGGLVKRAGEALARAIAAGGDRAEPADPPKKRDRISIG